MIPINTSNLLGLGDLLKDQKPTVEEPTVDVAFEELLNQSSFEYTNIQDENALKPKAQDMSNDSMLDANKLLLEHEYNFKLLNKISEQITKAKIEHSTSISDAYNNDLVSQEFIVELLGRSTGLMAYQSSEKLSANILKSLHISLPVNEAGNSNATSLSDINPSSTKAFAAPVMNKQENVVSNAQFKDKSLTKPETIKSMSKTFGYEVNQMNYQPFLFTLAASDKGLNIYYRNYFTKENELKKYIAHLEQSGFKINRVVVNGNLVKGNTVMENNDGN
ncbi:MAG: hypothetical protein HWE27_17780 [Gammaproteobacteria bacterium]|nr:hypothetical protein [Gammaproteobacteria bacterium]